MDERIAAKTGLSFELTYTLWEIREYEYLFKKIVLNTLSFAKVERKLLI
jgi:hypothetical protein